MSIKTVECANHLANGLREIFRNDAEVHVIPDIHSDPFRSDIEMVLSTTESQTDIMKLVQAAIAGIGLPGFSHPDTQKNPRLKQIEKNGGGMFLSGTASQAEQIIITTVTTGAVQNGNAVTSISVKDYSGNRHTAI